MEFWNVKQESKGNIDFRTIKQVICFLKLSTNMAQYWNQNLSIPLKWKAKQNKKKTISEQKENNGDETREFIAKILKSYTVTYTELFLGTMKFRSDI